MQQAINYQWDVFRGAPGIQLVYPYTDENCKECELNVNSVLMTV